MSNKMKVTGIILAGGKSSRMGAEKGLQLLCGKPLISYAIQALNGLCSEIIISSSSNAYAGFGFKIVADQFPGIGPMGGIYSSLKQSTSTQNLVLSCDLPFVTGELMAYILKQGKDFEVAVPWEGERHYEPLCGFYNQSVLHKLNSFIEKGNYKLPDLFEEIAINRLNINEQTGIYHPGLFLNINTPTDLELAEKQMQK
jgi:molybdopterin-guanine dinucleotide biosynthesis protein A